ncbi:hypothetical protein PWY87_13810 [Kribbella solani]|uniref:hypothetical protein n=1 Tax=Kribbella solani TaxID=236067 RepID=UPI0029BD4F47|nr:hypothetical protein [Kribbella solani]MDX3002758.1 hypothetical protein [Kribbella solani]
MPATTVHTTQSPDGTISLVPAAPTTGTADFTHAVLDVAGAVLTWSVLDGPTLPTAHIHDPVSAQQWLWALYSEQVATAEVAVVTEVPALARTAGRLAFAHWAARWWPASYLDGIPDLNPAVLALETAALTHQCQQLFDDDDCIPELIEEHQSALVPLLHWLHSPSITSPVARQLVEVLRLIDDAADCAGLDSLALRTLHASLAQESDITSANELIARKSGYALAAGAQHAGTGRLIARGNGINDWRRYPPGFVDAAEEAISWTLRAQGARRQLDIEVVAHPSAPTGTPLAAEVRLPAGSRPDQAEPPRIRLTRQDDSWTGQADITLPSPEQLLIGVEVLLPGFDPGAAADASADRAAIRNLARERMRTEPAGQLLLAEVLAGAGDDGDY